MLTALDRAQLRFLTACVLSLVLLQRIAMPFGGNASVPLVLPLLLVLLALAAANGILHVDPGRSVLTAGALAACGVATLLHLALGAGVSLLSYAYLLATYLPFALVLAQPGRVVADKLFDRFETLMTFMAIVAVMQMCSQLAGVEHVDPLDELIPEGFLIPGYITTYPIDFGSPLFKSNGYLFLEPSLLSQYLGAAIVLRLARGQTGLRLLLYFVALVTTVAGTGIVVVIVGALLVLRTRRARAVKALLGSLVAAGAVAAVTPVGAVLLFRLTEANDPDSSASLRFVQPFNVIGAAWSRDATSMLIGNGPGSSDVTALTGSTALQTPVPLKLLYEYGGIAALIFLLFIAWCVLSRPPLPPLAVALFVAYLILSSALLQPVTVLTLWLLTSALSHVSDRVDAADSMTP